MGWRGEASLREDQTLLQIMEEDREMDREFDLVFAEIERDAGEHDRDEFSLDDREDRESEDREEELDGEER